MAPNFLGHFFRKYPTAFSVNIKVYTNTLLYHAVFNDRAASDRQRFDSTMHLYRLDSVLRYTSGTMADVFDGNGPTEQIVATISGHDQSVRPARLFCLDFRNINNLVEPALLALSCLRKWPPGLFMYRVWVAVHTKGYICFQSVNWAAANHSLKRNVAELADIFFLNRTDIHRAG